MFEQLAKDLNALLKEPTQYPAIIKDLGNCLGVYYKGYIMIAFYAEGNTIGHWAMDTRPYMDDFGGKEAVQEVFNRYLTGGR